MFLVQIQLAVRSDSPRSALFIICQCTVEVSTKKVRILQFIPQECTNKYIMYAMLVRQLGGYISLNMHLRILLIIVIHETPFTAEHVYIIVLLLKSII